MRPEISVIAVTSGSRNSPRSREWGQADVTYHFVVDKSDDRVHILCS